MVYGTYHYSYGGFWNQFINRGPHIVQFTKQKGDFMLTLLNTFMMIHLVILVGPKHMNDYAVVSCVTPEYPSQSSPMKIDLADFQRGQFTCEESPCVFCCSPFSHDCHIKIQAGAPACVN